MIRICFVGLILALAVGPANAEYFFMVIDTMAIDNCEESVVKGPENIAAKLESNPGVECELDTSKGAYSVITCNALQRTTTYLTDSEEACASLLSEVKNRLEQ
ncbi:MAG: hypothetical protein ACR2QU_08315 [Gammaproteobacteria bacterium]